MDNNKLSWSDTHTPKMSSKRVTVYVEGEGAVGTLVKLRDHYWVAAPLTEGARFWMRGSWATLEGAKAALEQAYRRRRIKMSEQEAYALEGLLGKYLDFADTISLFTEHSGGDIRIKAPTFAEWLMWRGIRGIEDMIDATSHAGGA